MGFRSSSINYNNPEFLKFVRSNIDPNALQDLTDEELQELKIRLYRVYSGENDITDFEDDQTQEDPAIPLATTQKQQQMPLQGGQDAEMEVMATSNTPRTKMSGITYIAGQNLGDDMSEMEDDDMLDVRTNYKKKNFFGKGLLKSLLGGAAQGLKYGLADIGASDEMKRSGALPSALMKQLDQKTKMALMQMKIKQQRDADKQTSAMQNYEYLRGLPEGERAEFKDIVMSANPFAAMFARQFQGGQ